jgi:hypothetical protein
MESAVTLQLGLNSVTFEPPDTMYIVTNGYIDGLIARQLMEQLVEWSANKPYVLLVVNVVKLSSFSTEARKILTSNGHRLPPRVLALFGGSFATRVLLDLMDRASWLLGSRNRMAKHWPDEKSARAWVNEMRFVLSENTK